MSTNDVPGYQPRNSDELARECWAEHDDGSLIFVESTEDQRVIYLIFDMSVDPIVEYRDSMAMGAFQKAFSWDPKNKKSDKWTWHDKTPFCWDRIIRKGATAGVRYASATDQLNAAERVRQSREIHHGRAVDPSDYVDRQDRIEEQLSVQGRILRRLQRAILRRPRGRG